MSKPRSGSSVSERGRAYWIAQYFKLTLTTEEEDVSI